jgi:hypothetical protein
VPERGAFGERSPSVCDKKLYVSLSTFPFIVSMLNMQFNNNNTNNNNHNSWL